MRLHTQKQQGESAMTQKRDWSIGDVIAAYVGGTIVLDDGITTWNDIRAREFFDKYGYYARDFGSTNT